MYSKEDVRNSLDNAAKVDFTDEKNVESGEKQTVGLDEELKYEVETPYPTKSTEVSSYEYRRLVIPSHTVLTPKMVAAIINAMELRVSWDSAYDMPERFKAISQFLVEE